MIGFDSHKYGLVSLLDMMMKYAFIYCLMSDEITKLETFLQEELAAAPQDKIVFSNPPKPHTAFIFILNTLKHSALKVHLPSVKSQIRRIEEIIKAPFIVTEMIAHVNQLRVRLQDDLESQNFLYVPDNMVDYYSDAAKLFSPDVIEKFPAALDDIEGAGRCLALGEGTACVLQLMRVMEVGLKALSKSLGIPYAPSWESHLNQIQKQISLKRDKKEQQWLALEPFYSELSGDLISVKQAWRNPTMHVGRKYSREEAEEIFRAVRTFMKRLARYIYVYD